MEFVRAIMKSDLQIGQMKGTEIGGKEILIANVDGGFLAIGNRCTHMACMLSDGRLDGDKVVCACHGSVFSLRTGNVVKAPAKKPEPAYQTRIEGDEVLVSV